MVFDYRNEYNRYKRYYTYLEPVIKNPSVKLYFSLILSFLAMSVFGVFAIRPTVSTIVSLGKEIEDDKKVNTALQEKINTLSAAQSDFAILSNDLPLVFSSVPTDPEVADLIGKIEDLVNKSSLKIESIQFQSSPVIEASSTAKRTATKEERRNLENLVNNFLTEDKRESALANVKYRQKKLSFSLSISGDYQSILYFLENLAYFPRMLTIQGTTLSITRNDKTHTETLVLNITANAYFLGNDFPD